MDATEQSFVDKTLVDLDGTENKVAARRQCGPAVSLAVAKAAAEESGLPLHRYLGGQGNGDAGAMMNVSTAGTRGQRLDMQEFMIVPVASRRSARRCAAARGIHALRKLLVDRGLSTAVGDEGGFAPRLPKHEAAIKTILEAIEAAGYRPAEQVALALDCASSEFFEDGEYTLAAEGLSMTAEQFVDYLAAWVEKYPIISIEDGMAEDDWDGWKLLTRRLGKKVQLVGDDLFVTNTRFITAG